MTRETIAYPINWNSYQGTTCTRKLLLPPAQLMFATLFALLQIVLLQLLLLLLDDDSGDGLSGDYTKRKEKEWGTTKKWSGL